MISRGDTDGVFQLESAGMRQFLMQLKPDCFEDIIAGIALYRPGPMESIPRYIQGKHDPTSVHYEDERLEPILSTTYGCMVYQEQVMEIVRTLGGYSLGRADIVRRAMSKKKHDVMAREREYFVHGTEGVEGAVKRGVSERVADHIFDEMMDFASYAFNKAHAACYAVTTYRTAYLKRYFPVEFLAAMINGYMYNSDSVAEYVYSARRSNIKVLGPDVNKSRPKFAVEDGSIRFGLAAVKNVGEAVMEDLVREREQHGPFKDFWDFCDRVSGLNKRMVENMIYAGCFDSMGYTRTQLLKVYDQAMELAAKNKKNRDAGQMSLFDFDEGEDAISSHPPIYPAAEMPHKLLLQKEREATGLYLSGHPLDDYMSVLNGLPVSVMDLVEADGAAGLEDNAYVTVGGLLTACKTRPTKNNNGMMGYANLEGVTGSVECVIFPRTLQLCGRYFHDDAPVLVKGRLNIREDRVNSLLIEEMTDLEGASKKLYIRLPVLSDSYKVQKIIQNYPGQTPIVLVDSKRVAKAAPRDWNVKVDEELMSTLQAVFGKENVILR